jgi:sortase (surface protein transpeptidase)
MHSKLATALLWSSIATTLVGCAEEFAGPNATNVAPTSPATVTAASVVMSADHSVGNVSSDYPRQDTVRSSLSTATATDANPEVLPEVLPLVQPTAGLPTLVPQPTRPPTATPDPFHRTGVPVRLVIPAIGVDAFIESVGLTASREMDVPKGWMNAGWYREGFYPGEPGNAVIDGHLDSTGGGPAVFWDLDKLVPGDEVSVIYEDGTSFTFAVQGNQTFAHNTRDTQTIQSIFGPSQTSDLNLITCDGAWDHGQATYSQRLVVFTTLVPDKTVRAGTADVYD